MNVLSLLFQWQAWFCVWGGGAWGSSDLVCPPCPPSQPAQEGSPRTSHCWEAGQGHGHLEEQADFVQIYRFSPYLTTVNIR